MPGLVELARGTGRAWRPQENQKSTYTPFPHPCDSCDVVDNKWELKKERNYPTISLIIRGLLSNFHLTLSYFQLDRLWKSRPIGWNNDRAHDVYGQKRVRLKARKTHLLFSIGYRQQNGEGPGAKATMCMSDKNLGSRQHSPAVFYLIENKARRSLAVKSRGFRTYDVFEVKGLIVRSRLFDSWGVSSRRSLYIASRLAFRFINTITYRRPCNEARLGRRIVAQRDNSAGMRDAFLLLRA
jgi:hypothetical protein